MRVMIALENRFLKTRNGNVYSSTLFDYSVWQWYLQTFDEVEIFARVKDIPENELDKLCSSGPNVTFTEVPSYLGPWQFLMNIFKLNSVAKKAIDRADSVILFVPGAMSFLLWRHLWKKKNYAVEVKGDPWDAMAPGSSKSLLRPLIRSLGRWVAFLQCRDASVISYVTSGGLQKRYPPGGVEISFSDVRLGSDDIIDDAALDKRIERIRVKSESGKPWRLCHLGMLGHLYKSPDIIIEAVSRCIKKGFDIELFFIGDGKLKGSLQKQASDLGIAEKVEFLGKITAGKPVLDELDKADMFLLPSRQEGLPRALVEAMARGLPCIGSTVGGIPELLLEEDLVAPGITRELDEKIACVLSDPERLIRMAQRNLQVAREYHPDILNKKRIEFYNKIIELTEKG